MNRSIAVYKSSSAIAQITWFVVHVLRMTWERHTELFTDILFLHPNRVGEGDATRSIGAPNYAHHKPVKHSDVLKHR